MNVTLQVKLPTDLGQTLEKRVAKLRSVAEAQMKQLEKELHQISKRAASGEKGAVEKLDRLQLKRGELMQHMNKLTMASLFRAAAKEVAKLTDDKLEKLLATDEVFRGAPRKHAN